jgi:hypothetical protein
MAPAQHAQRAIWPRDVQFLVLQRHQVLLCLRTPKVRARVWGVTAPFATALLGWKPAAKANKLGWSLVPNFADVDSPESVRIAAGVLDHLAVPRDIVSDVPKDPGGPLEQQAPTT